MKVTRESTMAFCQLLEAQTGLFAGRGLHEPIAQLKGLLRIFVVAGPGEAAPTEAQHLPEILQFRLMTWMLRWFQTFKDYAVKDRSDLKLCKDGRLYDFCSYFSLDLRFAALVWFLGRSEQAVLEWLSVIKGDTHEEHQQSIECSYDKFLSALQTLHGGLPETAFYPPEYLPVERHVRVQAYKFFKAAEVFQSKWLGSMLAVFQFCSENSISGSISSEEMMTLVKIHGYILLSKDVGVNIDANKVLKRLFEPKNQHKREAIYSLLRCLSGNEAIILNLIDVDYPAWFYQSIDYAFRWCSLSAMAIFNHHEAMVCFTADVPTIYGLSYYDQVIFQLQKLLMPRAFNADGTPNADFLMGVRRVENAYNRLARRYNGRSWTPLKEIIPPYRAGFSDTFWFRLICESATSKRLSDVLALVVQMTAQASRGSWIPEHVHAALAMNPADAYTMLNLRKIGGVDLTKPYPDDYRYHPPFVATSNDWVRFIAGLGDVADEVNERVLISQQAEFKSSYKNWHCVGLFNLDLFLNLSADSRQLNLLFDKFYARNSYGDVLDQLKIPAEIAIDFLKHLEGLDPETALASVAAVNVLVPAYFTLSDLLSGPDFLSSADPILFATEGAFPLYLRAGVSEDYLRAVVPVLGKHPNLLNHRVFLDECFQTLPPAHCLQWVSENNLTLATTRRVTDRRVIFLHYHFWRMIAEVNPGSYLRTLSVPLLDLVQIFLTGVSSLKVEGDQEASRMLSTSAFLTLYDSAPDPDPSESLASAFYDSGPGSDETPAVIAGSGVV